MYYSENGLRNILRKRLSFLVSKTPYLSMQILNIFYPDLKISKIKKKIDVSNSSQSQST